MSTRTVELVPELREYLLRVGVREPPVLARLREETAAHPMARMQIAPEQGAFMTMLARLLAPRAVLEVGTFTGYSSTALLLGMPPDGRITCLDVSDEYTALARRTWAGASFADRAELVLGEALVTLDRFVAEARRFDLVFVDADKENLLAYHERCLVLLRPGGVVLYDNVLWGGAVADPEDQRPSTVAIRRLNDALAADERIDVVMLPVGDGLTIARKR